MESLLAAAAVAGTPGTSVTVGVLIGLIEVAVVAVVGPAESLASVVTVSGPLETTTVTILDSIESSVPAVAVAAFSAVFVEVVGAELSANR